MPDTDAVRALVDNYLKTFSSGDRDAWLANFAPDASQDDPVGAPTNVGHDAIGAFYDGLVQGFGVPEIELLHEPIICGNEVAMALHVHAGPEGSRVHLPLIIDHLVLDDDCKITSLRAFWDVGSIVPA